MLFRWLGHRYNHFVAKHIKAGKTMAQAAKLWNAEKKKVKGQTKKVNGKK